MWLATSHVESVSLATLGEVASLSNGAQRFLSLVNKQSQEPTDTSRTVQKHGKYTQLYQHLTGFFLWDLQSQYN